MKFKHSSFLSNKKGEVDLNSIPNLIVVLTIGLLILTGVLVGTQSFYDSQMTYLCTNTTHTRNGTTNCFLSTNGSQTSAIIETPSSSVNITRNMMFMTNNLGSQLPTVGTMFGVALILSAIGLIGVGIALGARKLE